MADRILPGGVVTLLFTDVQDSTKALHHLGDEAFEALIDEHHAAVRKVVSEHGGVEVSTEGDSFFVAFDDAARAVDCAVAIQRALDGLPVRVRAGLHTGAVRVGSDNYVGLNVHVAARISSAAHGGQILVSAETVDAADGRTVGEFRSLGHHRLKDLSSPVELLQVVHDDLASEFPPPRSLSRAMNNLPILSSSFVGRDDEKIALTKEIGKERLVTIFGPGGIGKTRLALEVAAAISCDDDHEVWLVDLGVVPDGAGVPEALSRALLLPPSALADPMDAVTDALATRRAIVLLDNCEHVVAAAASAASTLLSRCARLRVLATSRVPLDIAGEAVFNLGPLDGASNSEGSGDAVALFIDRAEAASGLEVDAQAVQGAQEICDLVEGVPLAIELAASRTRSLSLADLAAGLENSVALLSKGRRDAPPRHQSLDAALSWSFDLLRDGERQVLTRLSIAEAAVSTAAATALVEDLELSADIVEVLDSLVDSSLLSQVAAHAAGAHYRMLVPIRTFARERLGQSGDLETARQRHADYFASVEGDAIDSQLPDVVAAARHVVAGGSPDVVGRMLSRLRRPLLERGRGREAVAFLEQFLNRDDLSADMRQRALIDLTLTHERLGRLADASGAATRARELARHTADRAVAADLDYVEGVLAARHGDHVAARAHLDAALVAASELDNRAMRCRCLNQLFRLDVATDDLSSALALALEVVAMPELETLEIDDQLVSLVIRTAASPTSQDAVDAMVKRAAESDDRGFALAIDLALGLADVQRGAAEEGAERLAAVERAAADRGLSILQHLALYGHAVASNALGHDADAIAAMESALHVADAASDLAHQVAYEYMLSSLYEARGELEVAVRHARGQARAARAVGDEIGIGFSLANTGVLLAKLGNTAEARAFLQAAVTQGESLPEPSGSAVLTRPLLWHGKLDEAAGDLQAAADYLARASAAAEAIGNDELRAEADEARARVRARLGPGVP